MTDTDSTTQADPRGKPDDRSRAEWLLLAVISLNDLDSADAYWQQHVSESRRGMLGLRNGWRWDHATQSYISHAGQVIGGADLKRQAEALVDEAQHAMMAEARRVAIGELSIDQWQRRQADDVKDLYLALSALACGGWANLNPEMIKRVQGLADKPPGLAYSIDRLFDFARDIASGENGTEEAIANRAGMYAEAGVPLFEDIASASHQAAKDSQGRPLYLFEKNILGPNEDHCPDCPAETKKGWVSIGSLIPIGSRKCTFRCKCRMAYSLTGLDED